MVNTRVQAEAVVRAMRYAPEGSRSWGPSVVGMRVKDNREFANQAVACIPMIETQEALDNLDDILSTPGIDAIYVGPADLSISLGLAPQNNDGNAKFDSALLRIVESCRKHGVVPGVHAGSGAVAAIRRRQGFKMITVSADLNSMRTGMKVEMQAANKH
jgi:4-hydroxy-2-oxoheptanedioate aldolase